MSIEDVTRTLAWPMHSICFVCRKAGIYTHASVRIFSGSYGGGGFPACPLHENEAATEALAPLLSGSPSVSQDYRVTAFEVTTNEIGDPRRGRKLWTAQKRQSLMVALTPRG